MGEIAVAVVVGAEEVLLDDVIEMVEVTDDEELLVGQAELKVVPAATAFNTCFIQ